MGNQGPGTLTPSAGFTAAFASTKPVKINLGAGNRPMDDETWTNCDLYPGRGIQKVFDAGRDRWPFADGVVTNIFAMHSVEHIPDLVHVMREAQRVTRPGGHFLIRVPYGDAGEAMGDPTHVRPMYPFTFAAFMPGYKEWSINPQHEQPDWPDGWLIDDVRLILADEFAWMRRWPWKKLLPVSRMVHHLNNMALEMWVNLHRLSDDDHRLLKQGHVRAQVEVCILSSREAREKAPPCAVERALEERAKREGGR